MREETERKTYFAKADHRGKERVFGIKAIDRSKHVYIIGKTGMGKSVLLENMAVQDIQNGNGVAFIDPHGETAATLLDYVPEERVKDVIHFAPSDMAYPISFNIMEDVGYDKRHLVVSGLVSSFKRIWLDMWSARMEYILSNTLFALLEYPDSTLLDVNRMLINKEFRKDVISHITDPVIKSFWTEEFANYTDRYTQDATPAIQNKIGQFVSNPLVRNILGQPHSSFDFRKAMDEKKILIMNLSKGRMGDTNSKLLGSMLIIKIYLAAMSRADSTASELAKLPSFYFFVDEFQSFANETFADILSESRKYKLSLTIAHQYIGQMPDEVREAVFGNVGTTITFRIGAEDAEVFEKEFSPTFYADDMVNLGLYQIYLKLMIDGLASKPFSATTLPPIEKPTTSLKKEVIEQSRKIYAQPRAGVEEAILRRQGTFPDSPQARSKPKTPQEQKYSPAPQRTPNRSPNRRTERQTEQKYTDRKQVDRRSATPQASHQPPHQPFKKAFQKEPQEDITQKRESVSLNVLNPRNKQNSDDSRNADELKKVLEQALKNENQESSNTKAGLGTGQAGIPPSPKATEGHSKNQEVGKNDTEKTVKAQDTNTKNKPHEIPEVELKKMLNVKPDPDKK